MKHDDETPEQRAARLQLQKLTAMMAQLCRAHLDREQTGIGFALVMFDIGFKGSMAYAADGVREDLVKMFRELADKLEIDAQAKNVAFRTTRRPS